MSLPGRILIGLITIICTLAWLRWVDVVGVSSEPTQHCVEATEQERLRALTLEAIDQAFKEQVMHLFDIWMKDQQEQPKRASNGMQTAISAHIRARIDALKWLPLTCK